jgi:multiple antibiotic resistance protein
MYSIMEYLAPMAGHLQAFIPLFIAIDVIGITPIYISLTIDLNRKERRRIALQSILTALIVSLVFLFLGKKIFEFLGITVPDFQIAGGALLFVLAVVDLITSGKPQRELPASDIGVVPIGTPLIVGPAVLTVLIMMVDLHGIWPTMTSLLVNLGIVAVALLNADRILKLIGENGAKGLAKVISLLLAALGVMMIRRGLIAVIMYVKSGQ